MAQPKSSDFQKRQTSVPLRLLLPTCPPPHAAADRLTPPVRQSAERRPQSAERRPQSATVSRLSATQSLVSQRLSLLIFI
ncbi:hypothetical protein L1987_14573 [Smallanthus sonchifolius]|uniref:Uncharacterized protein n=1 Tax=Smallanthus sonchifolius TaxID=185202 RepID=A0ACB9J408_9ASTR|nr:hypothetical protein L1987_14573 [Smallanthus sonchifolius]